MSLLGGMSESERQHVQARVRAAMDAQVVNEGRQQVGPTVADAEARLRMHIQAIEAGANPTALVDAINRAHAEWVAAKDDLALVMVGRRLRMLPEGGDQPRRPGGVAVLNQGPFWRAEPPRPLSGP